MIDSSRLLSASGQHGQARHTLGGGSVPSRAPGKSGLASRLRNDLWCAGFKGEFKLGNGWCAAADRSGSATGSGLPLVRRGRGANLELISSAHDWVSFR
jgi:hypothetical protein